MKDKKERQDKQEKKEKKKKEENRRKDFPGNPLFTIAYYYMRYMHN